ncbi:MAG TPA: ATP-binding protein, partial [Steroidobacteraceae bacterium]|nr:ATP-binding protein [Steroidobacteraceae bacterium]
WTWQTIDLLLQDTARWYRTEGVPPDQLDKLLASRMAGVRQVRLIAVFDRYGEQRYRSLGPPTRDLHNADRSYFTVQRNGPGRGMYISEPLISRSEHRPSVVLSRRLDTPGGDFDGIVTAIVDMAQLKQFYGAVDVGAGGAIYVLRSDGTLLVSNPDRRDIDSESFATLAGGPAPASPIPIQGKRVFAAVARARDTPLLLAVTRDAEVALQPWRNETLSLAVRTAVLTLLGCVTLAALLRQLRRVEQGEEALRESEERYALAMEAANEGHYDWNLVTGEVFMSPKMKLLHGQQPDTPAVTGPWLRRADIHPDDLPRMRATRQDCLEGRAPGYEIEYRVRHPEGEWRWLHSRGRCLSGPDGRAIRFVGAAIDVTASKQAVLEREHLESQLRQSHKMEAIGTLAGGIAHDFNNILGAIIGYGELAQSSCEPGSDQKRYLDNVMQAAERAKTLVDRILGFSRSGLSERLPVNLQSVIEEALAMLAASLPAQIRLDKQLAAPNAAVIGDATRLHQVIMNLCTNAQQAMPEGGVLTVRLEPATLSDSRPVARGTLIPGKYLRLVVQDTGGGIAESVYERIFDPFFTTKSVGAGTGLGLSLVHGIVADLGGAIDVVTQAGRGTRFEIWLPDAGEAPRPVAAPRTQLPPGAGEAVMIVDDEAALVSLSEEILAELGYEPVGFATPVEALQALRADPGRFDVLLTDEAMPEMTGTELARAVREIRAHLPIVLMSGHGGPDLVAKAAALGVTEVLHKPLQRRELAEALARVRGKSAPAGGPQS